MSLVFHKLKKNKSDYDDPVDGLLKSEITDEELLRKSDCDDPLDVFCKEILNMKSY